MPFHLWLLLCSVLVEFSIFATAKIRRIGHDHHEPFQVVLVVVVVVVLKNQAVTRGKNKLPHDYYTSDPQDFYRF